MAAKPSPAGLRYLSAARVRCPLGSLAEYRVCTEDAKPLGTISGVLIDPSSRRLAYLVLRSPGLLLHRTYLLAFDDGAVLQLHPKMVRMTARRRDLVLEAFAPSSVAELTDDDLPAAAVSQNAA